MNSHDSFAQDFETLTGHSPFPWQEQLYHRFLDGNMPTTACIPTGLGKTSVIAIWLLALRQRPGILPRRLVYVVNRRTVVDQTTAEVQRLRESLPRLGDSSFDTLAISTLRGQFADNHEWSADPSRPAVISGTVDMIGSRLLFEGYRIGFKSRPLHAGFLGQDALLVHDEAHLEPAFQKLIESIECEQKCCERTRDLAWPKLRVMQLTATTRDNSDETEKNNGVRPFELTDEEKSPPDVIPEPSGDEPPIHTVWRGLKAKKALALHRAGDGRDAVTETIADLALKHKESNAAVLVFVRTLDDVKKVRDKVTNKKDGVPEKQVQTLTGTMRGLERDCMAQSDPVFMRFLPEKTRNPDVKTAEGIVYLVCTSAGEVGIDISADHMVCDLSTFDSMAQRLGRVNRYGDGTDTRIDVVHPVSLGKIDKKTGKLKAGEIDKRRQKTLDLLKTLPVLRDDRYDASPLALGNLDIAARQAAFAPEPTILPATDILFDAWAMTTIRNKMPGRPPVAPYLHGLAEWEPPRTSVAWREEVEYVTGELLERYGDDFPRNLLDEYPLKPNELLSDRTDRVYQQLQGLIADPKASVKGDKRVIAMERMRKNINATIWLINDLGAVTVSTLGRLLDDEKRRVIGRLADTTVLLPPSVGGLAGGMLNAESHDANDVADHWFHEDGEPRRLRLFSDDPQPSRPPSGMALIRTVDLDPLDEEFAPHDEDGNTASTSDKDSAARMSSTRRRFWHWFSRPRAAEDATRASVQPIGLDRHTTDVVKRAGDIVTALDLPDDLQRAVILAAQLHDLGKQREIWQRSIGNPDPTDWYAKSGKPVDGSRWRTRFVSPYRHEFGSLLDVLHADGEHATEFDGLSKDMQDVALHLIAAHHGYARPHFPSSAYDHERYTSEQNEQAAQEVMRRFACLQRRYGRWGLAYLESLLRAADWAASAEPAVHTQETVS